MKLHLCCGKRDFGKDWIHIDSAEYSHIDSHDITKLPFRDESIDLIYCSHGIAYFDREEIVPILKEWKRVLKVGGILRLATPDFCKISQFIIETRYEIEVFLGPLYGKMEINGNTIYHKTAYTEYSLIQVLYYIGFVSAKRYDWRNTEHAHFDDHSQAYIPHMNKTNGTLISLNIECEKI